MGFVNCGAKVKPAAWQFNVYLFVRFRPVSWYEPSLSVQAWAELDPLQVLVQIRAPNTGRPPQRTRPQIWPVFEGAPTFTICDELAMPPFMSETVTVTRYSPGLGQLFAAIELFKPLAVQVWN